MILEGSAGPPGASWDGAGVNFSLYSENAERVELCLFQPDGTESHRWFLPDNEDGTWFGYVLGCKPGQHYGYRVYGEYAPDKGLYFNPHKLLIDPYAKQLSGPLVWDEAVYGYEFSKEPARSMNVVDSAEFMPKSVVTGKPDVELGARPLITWADTILYELNVRGYTMRHPAVAEVDRGRFTGLAVAEVLQYIKALGITSIELMPCHAFADEHFLVRKGLRNYWGYNSLNFFSPHTRYLSNGRIDEFRDLANAVHDAGLELILDVVYNHTAEGDHRGPTLSFRGIDNTTYYRMLPDSPEYYINDTGCGNTINSDHPQVQALICDSMRYWVETMGVDGFRFDLAPILGRTATGFDTDHALFKKIEKDPVLGSVKLIAEPWDVGPGGYQLGAFPDGWAEWNDQYRDNVRRFWRGDHQRLPALAHSMHGSASLFEPRGRRPWSSINFITSHDGYTLNDLVSYEERHNLANGENNEDGHRHNFSSNFGFEGPTDDPDIVSRRRRQRLNFLATLLLSRGTPMILAGDEFGNSQQGNNNAYAQDNETGWIDWTDLERDTGFAQTVQHLIRLRSTTKLLKTDMYPHGKSKTVSGEPDIAWLLPDGEELSKEQWTNRRALMMLLIDTAEEFDGQEQPYAIAVMVNGSDHKQEFTLPRIVGSTRWRCVFSSDTVEAQSSEEILLQDHSVAAVIFRRE